MIIGITCVSSNWGIGKNNDLLYHIKDDMEFFKNHTMHQVVVMGENTMFSLPGAKPLKNRLNIVMCPKGHNYPGFICIHDFNQLCEIVTAISTQTNTDVYIIGGGMLYKSFLDFYDKVLVTYVLEDRPDAEVFFPNLDEDPRFICCESSWTYADKNLSYKFKKYVRAKEPENAKN